MKRFLYIIKNLFIFIYNYLYILICNKFNFKKTHQILVEPLRKSITDVSNLLIILQVISKFNILQDYKYYKYTTSETNKYYLTMIYNILIQLEDNYIEDITIISNSINKDDMYLRNIYEKIKGIK